MSQYHNNPEAVAALVQDDEIHKDLYINKEVFDLEMTHLFANTWVYVGHESQVPEAGDYYTTDIGKYPVIMVRDADGSINVVQNRCAHKGAKVVNHVHGNTGKFFRCPYHAWVYKLDGDLRAIPMKKGYDDTRLNDCPAGKGMVRVENTHNYRGFVFCKINPGGMSFEEYFGDSLSSIDNLVDRSPVGKLTVAGGVLRYLHNCNWKFFVENLNDTMHPMVAHESAAGTAREVWSAEHGPEEKRPMAVELVWPFAEGYDFFDKMGVKTYDNGHSYSGVGFSIHSDYSDIEGYEEAMAEAYGTEKARAILDEARHNTVYFPSMTIKGAIQTLRVARPVAVDKMVIESWVFRLEGAPDELVKRSCMYNRLINSPTSPVGHDDLHCYRSIQEGVEASGNDWISLHRDFDADELNGGERVSNGLSEISMRNQYRAWAKFTTESMDKEGGQS